MIEDDENFAVLVMMGRSCVECKALCSSASVIPRPSYYCTQAFAMQMRRDGRLCERAFCLDFVVFALVFIYIFVFVILSFV